MSSWDRWQGQTGQVLSLALTAPTVMPVSMLANSQQATFIDRNGRSDRWPVILPGDVNGGPAAALFNARGSIVLTENGAGYSTDGWACDAPAATVAGTTHFVSAAGSDSNDGLTAATPWRTVDKARRSAPAAGDAILFRGGDIFTDAVLNPGFTTAWTGTNAAPIIIGSYGTGRATISRGVFFAGTQGTFLIFDRLTLLSAVNGQCFQGGSAGNAASQIRVQRCELNQPDALTNTSPGLIYHGDTLQLEGDYIHGIGSHGVYADPGSSLVQAHRCIVYDVGGNAAVTDNTHHFYLNGAGHVVEDNLCCNPPAQTVFTHASSAISMRGGPASQGDSVARRNHVASTASGLDFLQETTDAGQNWRCLDNDIIGVGTATGGSGIFASADAQPLTANLFVTGNNVQVIGTGDTINLHSTTGTTTQYNRKLRRFAA